MMGGVPIRELIERIFRDADVSVGCPFGTSVRSRVHVLKDPEQFE
jgi:hypothetical protein